MSLNALNQAGYWLAQKVYEDVPNKLEKAVSQLGNGSDRAKWWGGFLKRQLDTDFCEFARMEAGGRLKAMIAEPPRGALLLLLYPGTVGPRLYRAWQRGRENGGDYREMGDVMRRDATAITFFVFALPAVVNWLSKGMQKSSGVNLLDKTSNQVLRYSQFRNYELALDNLDHPERAKSTKSVLKAILAEGNGESLQKALGSLHIKGEDGKLSEAITHMKASASHLVTQYNAHLKALGHSGTKNRSKEALAGVEEHLDALIQHFGHIEKTRNAVAQEAAQQGKAELAQAATRLKSDLSGALVKFAKERRLPSDVVSFAIVVGLIGWLPVTINSWWNKRQFNKKLEAKKAAATVNTAQPARTMQPAIPFHGFRPLASYPQRPINNPYAWRPQHPQQTATNPNPFLRY